MSSSKLSSLKEVCPGSYDWYIKVRIVRLWRVVSKKGEEFKAFNILLLDNKNSRLHAFVPGLVAENIENKIKVGKVHIISNFSVKDYKSDEKFRCVRSNRQIMFTTYTHVQPLDDNDMMIANNMFDFYDLGDLAEIANDNTYLTDVIGVIEKDMPLRNLTNKHGVTQTQVKFEITDGRCTKTVTFWDTLAEAFVRELALVKDFPPIIIIASAKITSWQGSSKDPIIDIANTSATTFYINSDDHTATHMRKMISTPLFSKHDFSSQIPEQLENLCIEQIKNLTHEYAQKEVVSDIQISSVLEFVAWYCHVCTSCYKEVDFCEDQFMCKMCVKNVPYPDKKFTFSVEATDPTGNISLEINDRAIRGIIGRNVFDLLDEGEDNTKVPEVLKAFQHRSFTVKLQVRDGNISKTLNTFIVTDMYPVNSTEQTYPGNSENVGTSITQDSASTIHLDAFSPSNFQTPEIIPNKRLRKKKQK